jgi:hypothetical protein
MGDERIPEIIDYYSQVPEESRLAAGSSRLEFERTKELIARLLPSGPVQIADVGGGSGPYAFWLAGLGHSVHLVDATPRLIEEAKRQNGVSGQPLASETRVACRRPMRLLMSYCCLGRCTTFWIGLTGSPHFERRGGFSGRRGCCSLLVSLGTRGPLTGWH